MDKQKRRSLSCRLQPPEGSSLGEIANWLNQMSTSEKNKKIGQALLMAYLPLARYEEGVSRVEIERCYRQFEDWLYNYKIIVRDTLQIREESRQDSDLLGQIAEMIANIQVKDKKESEKEVEAKKPKSQVFADQTGANVNLMFDGLS